jgi:acetyl-CoA carboxylase carboxyl transferase subunit alpha
MTVKSDTSYLPHEEPIQECEKMIASLERQAIDNPRFRAEVARLKMKLEATKDKVYSELSSWDRVMISRHPKRPHSMDYINAITTGFIELHGDRTFGDDMSVVGGLAYIDGNPCVIVGQEKGSNTEERVSRNFGMLSPEGFRKALRLMKLGEKLAIPVISLIDTPGAYPGLEAEQRGQGRVIAENLQSLFSVTTPIIVLIIGEGCSGGALGMGIGDVIAMLEHSYYSVISPEGCASILWKDAAKKQEAAQALRLNSEHMLALGIVDDVIPEPRGGAHYDRDLTFARVKEFLVKKMEFLKNMSPESLLEHRYAKFRAMGAISTQLPSELE